MPDGDVLDAIESTRSTALVGVSDAKPIVDAEVIESEPDRTDLPLRSV
jgi:hypothetical protein